MAGSPVSKDSQKIGLRMKQILKQQKITQEQAAFRIGLSSQGSLNHYLSGRSEIPINVINRFCDEFGVPVNKLFSNDENNFTNTNTKNLLKVSSIIWDYYKEKHIEITKDEFIEVIRYLAENEIYEEAQVRLVLPFIRKIVNQKKEALLA